MISSTVVDLSRIQFAMTALYHFIFVPLTLGLSFILAIMESVYVMTNRQVWRDMVKFWGILFGINFAMGVATGITMEFQFGTNWAYYSQFVGDIFGAPLAIEGMMAFFLEATFVGLFFFGWNKLSKIQHCIVTWLLALGTNLSALWILIANGWMQNPVGAHFDVHTMRMEVSSFSKVLFNPVAQAKFVHTVSAGYVTGAIFVLSISCFYMLRGKFLPIARRSFVVAASFGLAAALSVVVLGDESGYLTTEHQHMKIAAMESMWHTEKAPAQFTVFGWPNQDEHKTDYAIHIPYMLGIIATRSLDTPLPGIVDLVNKNKENIKQGVIAYDALIKLRENPDNMEALTTLQQNIHYLGYGLLLKRYAADINNATPAEIDKAAWSTVPEVAPIFFAFRIMVACGLFFILLFGTCFYIGSRRRALQNRWLLWIALFSLPLPWIASELGWFVAEYGRQPWVIEGILPTYLGTSSIGLHNIIISLIGFALFYSILFVVEMYLMLKYVKIGPDYILKKA